MLQLCSHGWEHEGQALSPVCPLHLRGLGWAHPGPDGHQAPLGERGTCVRGQVEVWRHISGSLHGMEGRGPPGSRFPGPCPWELRLCSVFPEGPWAEAPWLSSLGSFLHPCTEGPTRPVSSAVVWASCVLCRGDEGTEAPRF